jgi:hypothetical protein
MGLAITNRLDSYYAMRDVVEPVAGGLLFFMLACEVTCIGILAYGVKRSTTNVFESRWWVLGGLQTAAVGIVVLLALLGGAILPRPPT